MEKINQLKESIKYEKQIKIEKVKQLYSDNKELFIKELGIFIKEDIEDGKHFTSNLYGVVARVLSKLNEDSDYKNYEIIEDYWINTTLDIFFEDIKDQYDFYIIGKHRYILFDNLFTTKLKAVIDHLFYIFYDAKIIKYIIGGLGYLFGLWILMLISCNAREGLNINGTNINIVHICLFAICFVMLYLGIYLVKEFHNDSQPEIAKKYTIWGSEIIIISIIGVIVVIVGILKL